MSKFFSLAILPKKLLDKMGEEGSVTIFCQVVARFPVEFLLSHSTNFFVGKPFKVPEKIGYREILCMMGWYHVFPSKFFNLKVPQHFIGNPFLFQKLSGMERIYE